MLRPTLLLASFLLGLVACKGSVMESSGGGGEGGTGGAGGAGGGACEAPADPGKFELGTGEECFERLAANQEVTLVNGPQGGYHVWMAVGCQDCGSPTRLKYGVHDPVTGQPLAETWDLEKMVPLAGGSFPQAAGIIVNMPGLSWDPESQPPPAKGTHVKLWAEAYDGDTLLHASEVEVVIGDIVHWDPCAEDPESEFCNLG